MTKYFICTVFILALIAGVQYKAKAGTPASANTEMKSGAAEMPMKSVPHSAAPESPMEKGHGHAPAMDETPHIHHFHKHRVKKMKKHQHYWVASKVLLALIHGVLLFMAYMHVVH